MECGIISSAIRNHVNENSELEREEERQRAQQVKVLKFSAFDDNSNSVRMMRERDSGSELAEKPKAQEQEQEQEIEIEPQQPANYVLRENPKKTKRFVDSKELKVCKECGKGFQSLKALCGHMACHSDKERVSNNNNSKFKEEKKLVMDGYSDTESSGPKLRRVSKRVRYKSVGCSGIELEQEEVAISLMLLSRDCGHKGGSNSIAESSSNNSVVLEAKSSSIDMIISAKKVTSFGGDAVLVAKKDEKMKSDPKMSDSENSDSGYFRNGPKKIESDVSVDGFLRNGEFKKLEVESGSGFGASVDKSGLGKNLVDEECKDQEKRCSSKYELRKRTRTGIYKTEAMLSYFKNEADYTSNGETCRTNSQKRSKYECLTCNKTFHSHTALGGHRASHAKTNGCIESMHESEENSTETHDNSAAKLTHENGTAKVLTNVSGFAGNADRKLGVKKSKGHECPICFRMFKSGQALGGHKRSHFVGGREANSTTLTRQEPAPEAEIAVLFDLNLPAPMEDEADENVGLMAW